MCRSVYLRFITTLARARLLKAPWLEVRPIIGKSWSHFQYGGATRGKNKGEGNLSGKWAMSISVINVYLQFGKFIVIQNNRKIIYLLCIDNLLNSISLNIKNNSQVDGKLF